MHFASVVLLTASSKASALAVLWPALWKSGWQAGLFTDQPAIMFYSNWFRDGPQFSRLLCCLKKRNIAAFIYFIFFGHPSEKGLDINRLEENQLFSARVQLGFIALHETLIGGLFCVRVNFTADCVYWSSHKTKSRGDLSSWCQGGRANNLFYSSQKSLGSIGRLGSFLLEWQCNTPHKRPKDCVKHLLVCIITALVE